MAVYINFKALASFETILILDESVYTFYFEWNARHEFWTFSIYTQEDLEVISGLKIVANYELTSKFKAYPNMPQGKLYCVHSSGKSERVKYDSFTSGEFDLVYKGENE